MSHRSAPLAETAIIAAMLLVAAVVIAAQIFGGRAIGLIACIVFILGGSALFAYSMRQRS